MAVETYSYETEPFEASDGLAAQIMSELQFRGVDVVQVRLYGDMVEVDVEPAGRSLILIEGIILAVLSILGISVAGMFLNKFWPIVALSIAVGGAVALAWILRPPPGGEEMLTGIGGLAGRAGAVAGKAAELTPSTISLGMFRGKKKKKLDLGTKYPGIKW